MLSGVLKLQQAMAWGLIVQLALGAWPASAAPVCDVARDVSRLPEVLDAVNSEGQGPARCSTLDQQAVSQLPAARLGCPHHLMSRLTRDGQSGFLKESPSEACVVAQTRALKSSAVEIEARLARHPLTSLSAPEGHLEESCPKSKEETRKLLASEYYLDMNRLKQAELSSHEMLASIDSLLGQAPLADQRCDDSRLPDISARCLKLQGCSAAGGLKEQAEELSQVWPMIEKLEGGIRSARESTQAKALSSAMSYGYMSPSHAAQIGANSATIREKTAQLETLLSMYPALRGKEFRKRFDPKEKNTEEALRAQLVATRGALSEKQKAFRKASECLNSPLGCGLCDDYENTLSGTPEFDSSQFQAGDRATSDELDVQAYLAAASCRQNARGLRSEAKAVVDDFAIGAGLTIVTAGLGIAVAGGKAAATAAAAGTNASTVMGRVGQTLVKPLVRVKVSSRTAHLARNLILGGDVAFAGKGAQAALSECDALLNRLEPADNDGGRPASAQHSSCPGGSTSPQVQLMADYRACALSALLNVAPNLLPLAPAFVSAYRSSKHRLGRAAPKPKPELGPEPEPKVDGATELAQPTLADRVREKDELQTETVDLLPDEPRRGSTDGRPETKTEAQVGFHVEADSSPEISLRSREAELSKVERASPASGPSWIAKGFSEEALNKKVLQPPLHSVSLSGLNCKGCPTRIRVNSPISHAKQHFYDSLPAKQGESQQSWWIRRIKEFGRENKDKTTIFAPGITQESVFTRFSKEGRKVNAHRPGDGKVIVRGQVELEYFVPGLKKPKSGTFDVEFWVCESNCREGSPGDLISAFATSGPQDGLFIIRKSEAR